MKPEEYPKTKWFYVKDTIPEKHPYCITPKHLEYSEGMYLDVEGAEKKGAVCDICRKHERKTGTKPMTYAEHKSILLIGCKADIKKHEPALRKYLLSIKDQCEKDGYLGFAFFDEVKK